MNVQPYTPDSSSYAALLTPLLNKLYGESEAEILYLEGHAVAYDYCLETEAITFLPILVRNGVAPIGHVGLILDSRLPAGEAFFGFFEVIEDNQVFDTLWTALLDLAGAHGLRRLLGPVNGSIWHQYRCVKSSSDVPFFKTEPATPIHYHGFLARALPKREIGYSSGIREDYSGMLDALENRAANIEALLKLHNVTISVSNSVPAESWADILNLSRDVFSGRSWGYTPISADAFSRLFMQAYGNAEIFRVFLLHHGPELVGYCVTLRERNDMISKSICIAEDYQGKGLGNVLALYLHRAAHEAGIDAIQYVLVRDGNQIYNYSVEGVRIFRQYSAFEFEL